MSKELTGVSGSVEFYLHKNALGKEFSDLLERTPSGELRALLPCTWGRSDNKVLLRGLSYLLHSLLAWASGGPFVPSEIANNPTKNPFAAIYLAADDAAGSYPADAKPDWNESDGLYDTKLVANPGVAGEGIRAILTSDTSGPGLKRQSVAYPTTNPYREIEFTLFAQANIPVNATGSITFLAGGSHADGEWFELFDGINPKLRFELDSNASVADWDGDPANAIPVRFTGSETADGLRDLALAAVNAVISYVSLNRRADQVGSGLLITASAGGSAGVLTLTHAGGGEIGNQSVTLSTSPAFSGSTSALSGGSDANNLETTDDGIDNLPAKSIGFSAGVQCGNGEADSAIGTRAVWGLRPTLQGICDRTYVHEGSGLHAYSSGEKVSAHGAGYFASSEQTDVVRSVASGSGDRVLASGRVEMDAAAFSAADVGLSLTFTSGSNNGTTRKITKVVDGRTVYVSGTLTAEGSGFTTNVVHPGTGAAGFDGDVDALGSWDMADLGDKWRSASSAGPHELARVFSSAKSVRGVRVISASGVTLSKCPDLFKVQRLATQAQGNASGPVAEADLEPANAAHWIDVGAEVDFTASSQSAGIFAAEDAGMEYLFSSAVSTRGIKLTTLTAQGGSDVQVGELMIFEETAAVSFSAGTDDALRLATDGIPTGAGTPGATGTFKAFSFGALSTSGDAAQEDVSDVADWLNKVLRGWGIVAERSYLGHLLLRGSAAGDKSQLDLDSVANGSTAAAKLGLGSAATAAAGRTRPVLKLPGDALTIVYKLAISGDLPVSAGG